MSKIFDYVAMTCLLGTLVAPIVNAQGIDSDVGEWSWGGYAGLASLDSTSAAQQGVDDSAWVTGFMAEYTQSAWITSIGLDVVFYDDNQKFTQEVEGSGAFNDGDRSTASSSANGYLLYAGTGYQWLFTEQQNVAVRLQGGYGLMVSSERSIGYCTDCYSEDIDIDGGLYIKASALHSGDSVSFGGYIQQYISDGLNTVLGVSISSSF